MKIETPIVRRVRIPTKGKPWYQRQCRLLKPLMWEVMQPWTFVLPEIKLHFYKPVFPRRKIFINKGFIFDGASVPRILWWVPGLSPVGILLIPGLIHDYIYKNGFLEGPDSSGYIAGYIADFSVHRRLADAIFLRVGKYINGVIGIDYITWLAVRLFGWHAWNKHRKEEGENE